MPKGAEMTVASGKPSIVLAWDSDTPLWQATKWIGPP